MKTAMDIPDKEGRKRLVIVGGGFGGLKLARKLKSDKYQIVLLDKNNHHIFQPLLYQVATAGIEPSAISFPYRKIFKKREHFHIRICEAQRVMPENNLLETSIGTLAYDYLVIATGCDTNYFGNNDMAKQTMALKNTSEALFNRNQILDSFEQAYTSSIRSSSHPRNCMIIQCSFVFCTNCRTRGAAAYSLICFTASCHCVRAFSSVSFTDRYFSSRI